MVHVTLLAGVAAAVRGRPVRLTGRLGRSVLAVLALEPGRMVPSARLVDRLWGDQPPATSAAQVHTQVSRLRRALADVGLPDAVRRESGGYRLDSAVVRTDLAEVEEWLRAARLAEAQGHSAEAADAYRAALDRWPGPELEGVTPYVLDAEAPRLVELRIAAVEGSLAAQLDAGQPGPLIPELDALVLAHPLREGLHRMRMLALHRAGRRADALTAYHTARRILRDELGLDPSPPLRELAAEILGAGGVRRPHRRTPAQLPSAPAVFVGREAELARLRAVLAAAGPTGRSRVAVLHGLPGIGKTALALQAIRSVASFRDGQLYADFAADPAVGDPSPESVLDRFLHALGADRGSIPGDLAGRAAEFRTLTAGRRLLILLDNVSARTEVEPLLPADAGCVAVVTSQSPMAGLDASCRIPLAPLPEADGVRMLAAVAGAAMVRDEPDAAADIVRRCAGLPLAIRIAGARLQTSPHLTVATLAARLADDARRVDELRAGDLHLRSSLDAALRSLSDDARTVVTGLTRLEASTFGAWVVGPLLDAPGRRVDAVLDELVALSVAEPAEPASAGCGRFRMHDLIRSHAASRSGGTEDSALSARRVRAGG